MSKIKPRKLEKDALSRANILQEVLETFISKGIKTVTMDDIAAQLNMSKRTLYEIFTDKGSLVKECLMMRCSKSMEEILTFVENHNSVLEVILHFFELRIKEMRRTNPSFYHDLEKYPDVLKFFKKDVERLNKNTVSFFLKGVEQGFFCADVNYNIMVSLLDLQTEALMRGRILGEYSRIEVFESIVLVNIRGISTPKGIKLLDEFTIQYK